MKPVARFLDNEEEVGRFFEDVRDFIERWLPSLVRSNRSYLTVAVGCTGGQHRSVYLAERLAAHFSDSVRGAGTGAASRPGKPPARVTDRKAGGDG